MQINEKALEAARETFSITWASHGDADALESAIRAYFTSATPPNVAGLIERLEKAKWAITNGKKPDWDAAERAIEEAAAALRLSAGGGWREISEDDRPPLDTDVIMGHWQEWPEKKWLVEVSHYGSARGGWIHGRMTHWLPLDALPASPTVEGV